MLAPRRFAQFLTSAIIVLNVTAIGVAQPALIGPALTASPVTPGALPVVDKRAENAEQLRIAMRKLEATGSNDAAAAQEVAYYQTRENVLAQQDAVEQQIKDLAARKEKLDAELKASPKIGVTEAPTFIDLDRLKDDLATEQARAGFVEDKLTVAQSNIDKSETALKESEVKRREAQEALETGKEKGDVVALSLAADQARQAAALAAEMVTLRKREVEREQLAHEVQRLAVRVCQQKIEQLSPLVAFSQADFQAQVDDINKQEASAAKSLATRQNDLHAVNNELRLTQQEFDAATGDRAGLTEKLDAKRRHRERLSEEIDSYTQRLQRLAGLRLAWKNRFKVASVDRTSPDKETWSDLKTLQKQTKRALDELASDLRLQILRMRDVRSSLTSVSKKVETAAKGPADVLAFIQMQQVQLEQTLRTYEKNMVSIDTSRRVHEKLVEEIGVSVEALTPTRLAMDAWYQAELVWKYEVTKIGDKPITVRKIVTGLSILAGGWVLARFLSAMFANRLLKRFRLSKDATSAIRSLVFYGLLAVVVLTALNTINVPLTAFTILGGALAIGVGFGSQALINNFIGGLIMLAERPVRLGERITFGDFDGVVEDVGFRCTKLRTQSDHLVTIPNSTLVNESIENIDRRRTIRRTLNISLTYNTSRELIGVAVQAIRDILEERDIRERIHPIVGFEEFSPRVHFHEFATESLNLQVVYWYAPVDSWAFMEHAERVNFRIMEEFDRLDIEFAFPSKTAYVKNKRVGGKSAADSYAA